MANIKSIMGIIVVLAFIVVIVGCASNSAPPIAAPQGTPTPPSSATPSQKVKLADTNYWQYAHLISGDTLDNAAQLAIAGFSIEKKALADGTTQILLKASDPAYKDQSYVLKSGQQLYFIERSYGDDTATQEYNLGDDAAVIVDADGYIVK